MNSDITVFRKDIANFRTEPFPLAAPLKNMRVEKYLRGLQTNPAALRIIGIGSRAVALIHPKEPGQVLLLHAAGEGAKDEKGYFNKDAVELPSGTKAALPSFPIDTILQKTLDFARKYDQIIDSNLPPRFTHSTVLGGGTFEKPICVRINTNLQWKIASARLTKRIYGIALDYRDFIGAKPGAKPSVDSTKRSVIARDMAEWLYSLHYRVSPLALASKKTSEFQHASQSLTVSYRSSRKYKLNVSKNLKKLEELRDKLSTPLGSSTLDPGHARAAGNITAVGTNIGFICELAALLKDQIDRKLAVSNEIGLVHGDLHPGNILVNKNRKCVTGVCDWMNASFDNRAVDFHGFALASGLLPAVLKEYSKLETTRESKNPIDKELIHAYSAMYVITQFMNNARWRDEDKSPIHINWHQVREQVGTLAKLNPDVYSVINGKMVTQTVPPMPPILRIRPFASHPDHCL